MHWAASTTRAGGVSRNVRCEKCGQWYHYDLVREAFGAARAGGPVSAVQRAEAVAEARVIRALDVGGEVVPCPACGWVQAEMVREQQRRVAPTLGKLASILAAAGVIGWLFLVFPQWFMAPSDEPMAIRWGPANTVLTVCVGWAVAVLALRSFLRSRVNPNANYPRPTPVPGAINGRPGKAPKEQLERHERPV